MNVQELVRRFPEIPADLHDEPVVAELAECCDDLLRQARQPSNCAREYDAANQYYLKLIGPMSIYGYGMQPRDKLLAQLQELVERRKADPDGFAGEVAGKAADSEVRGPGCA